MSQHPLVCIREAESLTEMAGHAMLAALLEACRAAGYDTLTIEPPVRFTPGDVRVVFKTTHPKDTPEPQGPWWKWSDLNSESPDCKAPAIWGIVARVLGHRRKVTACTGQIQIECSGLPAGTYRLD